MVERDDERVAITAYAAFLRNVRTSAVKWSRGDDPPDYLLTLGGTDFAVEVTTVTPQYEREGRGSLSDMGLSAMMHRFTDSVKAKANNVHSLDTLYLFHLDGPHGSFESTRDDLAAEILRFIASNRKTGDIAMHEIATVGDYSLWMGKLQGKAPGLSWGYGAKSGLTEELVAEFNDLVQRAVADKRQKLSSIFLPKILLLIDQYSWLDAQFFGLCPICSSPDPTFHAVCVITSDSAVYPLWHGESPA